MAKWLAGINLPPTQGTSNSGAFIPGVYSFDYEVSNIEGVRGAGFTALRLPVNSDTASDVGVLARMQAWVEAIGGDAIVCMWDDNSSDRHGDGHGNGRVSDVSTMAAAWKTIHAAFVDFPCVMYEVFNEPFGYHRQEEASLYLATMMEIIETAGLPKEKCIVSGLGYADDVQCVAAAGWDGLLSYHIYPNWLPEGQRTQSGYSNFCQQALQGLSSRVVITEFGAALDKAADYEEYVDSGSSENGAADINCLRGLHDAVLAFSDRGEPLRGAFHWHGWHNWDCYDHWHAPNAPGAKKARAICRAGLSEG